MTKVLPLCLLVALLSVAAHAQTQAAFTITPGSAQDSTLTGHYQTSRYSPSVLPTSMSPSPCTSINQYCGVDTYWPEPCPPNINCDGQVGVVQLTSQATVSGLVVPFYLDFPSNGFLEQDCTLVYGPPQFNHRSDGSLSDGSKLGDTWNFIGNATCDGYAQGVTFSVVAQWSVVGASRTLTRVGYVTNYTYTLSGGSGIAQYVPNN